jgi:hypothetical protein
LTQKERRPRYRLTAPRALAKALLVANGYVFTGENDPSDRVFRIRDANAMLKSLRGLGFKVVPKTERQP